MPAITGKSKVGMLNGMWIRIVTSVQRDILVSSKCQQKLTTLLTQATDVLRNLFVKVLLPGKHMNQVNTPSSSAVRIKRQKLKALRNLIHFGHYYKRKSMRVGSSFAILIVTAGKMDSVLLITILVMKTNSFGIKAESAPLSGKKETAVGAVTLSCRTSTT